MYIIMRPQLTVLIIEVSLFQSAHNSRFDCMQYPGCLLYGVSIKGSSTTHACIHVHVRIN